jgi:hypothetical protein
MLFVRAIWHTLYEEQLCLFHVQIAVSFDFSFISDFYTKL